MAPLFITVVSVRVRGFYTHSANTPVRVAPVQVTYLDYAIQFTSVHHRRLGPRAWLLHAQRNCADTPVRVAPVQVTLWANSVLAANWPRQRLGPESESELPAWLVGGRAGGRAAPAPAGVRGRACGGARLGDSDAPPAGGLEPATHRAPGSGAILPEVLGD